MGDINSKTKANPLFFGKEKELNSVYCGTIIYIIWFQA